MVQPSPAFMSSASHNAAGLAKSTYEEPFPGAVGQSFLRSLKKDPVLAGEYKTLVGRQAKDKFRLEWVALKVEAAKKERVKEKKHAKTQACKGTYLPFRRVWDKEGQDLAGYQAPTAQNPTPQTHQFNLLKHVVLMFVAVAPWLAPTFCFALVAFMVAGCTHGLGGSGEGVLYAMCVCTYRS
jgi:hypothetical protein